MPPSPHNASIRNFVAADFEAIIALWNLTGVGGLPRRDNIQIIEKTIELGGRLFVLQNELEAGIIGTCWLTYDGRRIYLHHLAVHPDYQGQGLGKQLIQAAIDFAKIMKTQLKLEVATSNTMAKAIYNQFGFKELASYELHLRRDTQD